MCRLYAMLASHSMDASRDLLDNRNALLCQSRCDVLQRTHADGWGVVTYPSGVVHQVRNCLPAFNDTQFTQASQRAKSQCVLAHVRLASKGDRRIENCHPFVFGNWSFAHNGTIYAIESLRSSLVAEMPEPLAHAIRGETDSEVLFLWLLHRMIRGNAIRGNRCVSLPKMLSILVDSLAEIETRDAMAQNTLEKQRQSKLTTVLTNGRVMVASSLNHPLFWLSRKQQTTSGQSRQSIVLASEPMTDEPWIALDNASVISVSSYGHVSLAAIPQHAKLAGALDAPLV